MSCRHRSMLGSMANPPPLLIVIQRKISVLRRIQTQLTTPISPPPKVFALPGHDDVSHIMHMLPCSAYFRHHICHLLSLDTFCNATCLVSISYMGIMQ